VIRVVIGEPAPTGVEDLPLGEDVLLIVDATEYPAIISARYWADAAGVITSVSFSEKPKSGELTKPSVWTVDITP
jgi:hypothetical protein